MNVSVAMTGAASDLAGLLISRLLRDARVERIVAIDAIPPSVSGDRIEFRQIRLAEAGADVALAGALEGVRALYHLAVDLHRPGSSLSHELEVLSTLAVLSAVTRSKLERVILPSLTAVYGARPTHAAVLTEHTPVALDTTNRFLSDRIELERHFDEVRAARPELSVLTLRFAPIIGPSLRHPLAQWLRGPIVPTLFGYDPLWQLLHEEDAISALHLALYAEATGCFNIVPGSVTSLSRLVWAAGGVVVPLPAPLSRTFSHAMASIGLSAVPSSLRDYLMFSWVADGSAARQALGFIPRHGSHEAAGALKEG